jgi:hypothetical protein
MKPFTSHFDLSPKVKVSFRSVALCVRCFAGSADRVGALQSRFEEQRKLTAMLAPHPKSLAQLDRSSAIWRRRSHCWHQPSPDGPSGWEPDCAPLKFLPRDEPCEASNKIVDHLRWQASRIALL